MLHHVIDCVFHTVCGWVGYIVVRICTFGRVRLDWGVESESNVSEAIGVIFLLAIGIIATAFIR